jgi:formiminotetrahydrofolate cyclodeaminase
MSNHIWDQSIRNFLEQAGSSSPTPGGGSAAAVAAALGTAMASMAGNLSQGEKFAAIQPQITRVLQEMQELNGECERLLQADMASFDRYMDALKLPKQTDEEKQHRKNTLHQAILHAIAVPLRLITVCRKGMAHARSIAGISNKNVISDLGIGIILLEAAAQSALLTVEINLASLKDPEQVRQYREELSALMEEIHELKSSTLQLVRTRISE